MLGKKDKNLRPEEMTSWLDSITAVPAIGVIFHTNFNALFDYPKIIIPLVESIRGEFGDVTVESPSFGNFVVKSEKSGMRYILLPDRVLVEFNYAYTLPNSTPKFGESPLLKSVVEPQPYSNLLLSAYNEIRKVLSFLVKDYDIFLSYVGVVVKLGVDYDAAPPGIQSFVEHLSKPWKGSLESCATNLSAKLEDLNEFYTRCTHFIKMDKPSGSNELSLTLDWQRVNKSELKLTTTIIDKYCYECCLDAVKYFQNFGEGLDYE